LSGGVLIIVGLTGGIATGKSTVAEMFREAGAVIVDADLIAREVVEKGTPAWEKIRIEFGDEVLLDNQEIDRDKLGDIIFNDPEKKELLNSIVHPAVFQKMGERINEVEQDSPDAVVILDVPLLIESGMQDGFSDVVLVYITEELQVKRLMTRDGFSEKDAFSRIQSQMPIDEKKDIVDTVIDNSKGLEHTRKQVLEVYSHLSGK
jgi:dephospho-CoA kinase